MSEALKWKTPDEIIRLQRLKQKQKALQARLCRPQSKTFGRTLAISGAHNDVAVEKRKNPFADKHKIDAKKFKPNQEQSTADADISSEDSLFNLLAKKDTAAAVESSISASTQKTLDFLQYQVTNAEDLADLEQKESIFSKHIPIDWGLKTKLRILSRTKIPGNGLKSSEEASGITSFVRCLDLKTSSNTNGLDLSPSARFHQSTLYWQHPSLPWLTLYPRNIKSNSGFTLGDVEKTSLAQEWTDSFRTLFHLLRSCQCPYFYVCANSFVVLFRAAGIGGRHETHAFMTPTSRGIRDALKQQDIEFSMPLKKKSTTDSASNSGCENSSIFNFEEAAGGQNNDNDNEDDDDDEDHEKWLASLGVDEKEIRKMSSIQNRYMKKDECENDVVDQSVVLIEGVECQAFFNFLLNAKSTISKVGHLAGIPPTLIAPVAFPGATLRNLQTRTSRIRMDGVDYISMELNGIILPHILHSICNLLTESKDMFSVTMKGQSVTNALTMAAQQCIEDFNKENNPSTSDPVFMRENLSDCGISPKLLEAMCRCTNDAARNLERICYSKENGGYTWDQN